MNNTLNIPKQLVIDIVFAVLILSTSLVFIPIVFTYPIVFFVGVGCFIYELNEGLKVEEGLLLVFALFSVLLFAVGYPYASTEDSGSFFGSFVPYSLMVFFTIFFSKLLNIRILKIVFWGLTIEIVIGIIEFLLGVPYFIAPRSSLGETSFGDSDLLYFKRVYGLSNSVSIYAQKVMIAVVLLFYLKIKPLYKYLLFLVFISGLLVSFNRTAIVSTIAFLLVLAYIRINIKYLLIFFCIFIFIFFCNVETIKMQFFRGRETVDYSGRDYIFEFYSAFISGNPLFGNFVHKLWYSPSISELYHAHNSYLQTFASMGSFISILLFTYIVVKVKKNFSVAVFLLPFFLYSFYQYGILWGVSFLDIVFFYILLSEYNKPT